MAGDMAALGGLQRAELRNRVTELLVRSRFKIGVIFSFSIAFWIGLFWISHWVMRHLRNLSEQYSMDILGSMFYIFFFALSLMLVFSNAIITYSAFFKSKETAFLMSNPVRYDSIYLYKLSESIVFSSWAFLFLATPLMAAYGVVHNQGPGFYLMVAAIFLSFQFIPAAVGSLLTLIVAAYFPRTRRGLVLTVVLVLVALAVMGMMRMMSLRGGFSMDLRLASELFDNTRFSENPLLPSAWMMRSVIAMRDGRVADAFFFLQLIVANAFFLIMFVHSVSGRLIRRGWYQSQDMPDKKRWAIHRVIDFVFGRLLFFTHRSVRLIVIKDVKSFVRDPVQWSQFLIFFGLLGIYFASLRSFSYDERDLFWKCLHAQLNLMATSLTLATFSSRFIYPQLSLEGRRFWVIGMVPMKREDILFGKLALSFTCSLILSETLILVSSIMLRTPLSLAILHAIALFGICLGLSGLSVGLGALYPNFQEDNPSKIVAGFGGTLNLVLSLAFVVVVMAIQAIPCLRYFGRGELGITGFESWLMVSMGVIGVVSLAACFIPMSMGLKSVKNLEV